jgi:cytochrome P450
MFRILNGLRGTCPESDDPLTHSRRRKLFDSKMEQPSTSRFPKALMWASVANRDALSLYPNICFERLRVDWHIFGRKLTVLSDPVAAEHVLGRGARKYQLTNLQRRLLRPAFGKGLVVAEGSDWAHQRRLSLALVQRAERCGVEADTDAIDRRTDQLIARLREDSLTHGALSYDALCDELVAATLDVLALVIFGHREPIATPPVLAAVRAHRQALHRFDILDVLGVAPTFGSPSRRRLAEITRRFDARIMEAAAQLDEPLFAEFGLDGTRLRDFIVSQLSGFETTSLTLMWALALAATEPGWLRDIRDEPPPLLRRHGFTGPGAGATDRFIAETMRLYPPLPFLHRVALACDMTPSGPIERGTLVSISPFVMHRHHQHWQRPAMFDPDRFIEDAPSAFIPFGLGARRCVGMGLGRFLTTKLFHRIVASLDVKMAAALPAPRGGVSLQPVSPIMLRFQPRLEVTAP